MKREYVSFDVFDTCLIRRCGLPYKIWDLMADRLFGKDDSRGRLSFTGNRGYVEELLSKTSSFPNLDDIYTQRCCHESGNGNRRTRAISES